MAEIQNEMVQRDFIHQDNLNKQSPQDDSKKTKINLTPICALATQFVPVFDLDADPVGHTHRGEDEEGVRLAPQRISLVRDGRDSAAAAAASEGVVGSVVEAEAVLLLRRVEQICKMDIS